MRSSIRLPMDLLLYICRSINERGLIYVNKQLYVYYKLIIFLMSSFPKSLIYIMVCISKLVKYEQEISDFMAGGAENC